MIIRTKHAFIAIVALLAILCIVLFLALATRLSDAYTKVAAALPLAFADAPAEYGVTVVEPDSAVDDRTRRIILLKDRIGAKFVAEEPVEQTQSPSSEVVIPDTSAPTATVNTPSDQTGGDTILRPTHTATTSETFATSSEANALETVP